MAKDEGGKLRTDSGMLQTGGTSLGVETSDGTKLAQIGAIPSHGAADMAIGGTTYWTTQASAGFSYGASFSAFDVAEVYATDRDYPDGTVVCLGSAAVMTRCAHDGCHAAMIVSKEPGFGIGDPAVLREAGETCELLALAGRVRVAASGPIATRQLVTSDGAGGVRAMSDGELGFALGFALHDAAEGAIGIVVRPMFCRAPLLVGTGEGGGR